MVSENFNQFGPTFQSKIISSLLSDNKFIQTISDILEPKYFDSDANKWLSTQISKYFNEFRKAYYDKQISDAEIKDAISKETIRSDIYKYLE